ncbi:MAG: DNRLRE domain-containing protein [Anaerolineae bacterium]
MTPSKDATRQRTASGAAVARSRWRSVLTLLLVAIMAALGTAPAAAQDPGQAGPTSPQATSEYQCFYPAADTYVSNVDPTSNFGGAPTLVVQHTDVGETIKNTYLRFDLSPIPAGSTIVSAQLGLYLTQASASAAYSLARVGSPWQEFSLTWNSSPSAGGNFDNPTHDGTEGWKYWNAVQPVADWVSGAASNYGLVISTGLLDAPSPFASREAGLVTAPRLCVEWDEAGTPTDLWVTGLEVTQSIQNLNNTVRLVAGKRTFVRLHVQATDTPYRTFATLAANCDSVGRILFPVNPGTTGYIVVEPSPSRNVQNHAFLFELPSDCTDEAESITISGTLNPTTAWRGAYPAETDISNNWSGEVTVTFETAPALNTIVYLADYEYDDAGSATSVRTPLSEAYALRGWLKSAYPIAENQMFIRRIDFGQVSVDSDGNITSPNSDDYNAKLAAKRLADLRVENWYESMITGESHIRYYGIIDDEAGFMRGAAADIPSNVASGPAGDPSAYTNFAWDTDSTFADWYGGHELGHTLGRKHVACSGREIGTDANYPYTGGLISTATTGADAFFGFNRSDLANGIYGPTWSDIMTYCPSQWISDYTYEAILDYMQGNFTTTTRAANAAGDYLVIAGVINPATATAQLEPLFVVPDPVAIPTRLPGSYDIVLRSGTGTELARYAFTPADMEPGPPADITASEAGLARLLISEMVPFVAGTDQVLIEGPSGALAQVNAGPSTPSVTVQSPNGGEALSGDTVTVSWTASDPDDGNLVFNVDFSPDDGATWEVVALGVAGNQVDISRDNLLSTQNQGRFRVWASDGIHTSSDTSDTGFTVTTRAPDLTIISPPDGLVIARQQTLNLQAVAYSDVAGFLSGDNIRWVSSVDNLLATGAQASVTGLTEGVHTIIVRATDGKRDSFANFQVIVVADPSLLPESEDELQVAPQLITLHPEQGITEAEVYVNNASGTAPLDWQALTLTPWIQLGKTAGTTSDQVTVGIDITGLEPGSYDGTIGFLTGDIPGGSPESVQVHFNIEPEPAQHSIFLPLVIRQTP